MSNRQEQFHQPHRMKRRSAPPALQFQSRAEAATALARVATALNQRRALQLEKDAAVLDLERRYADQFGKIDGQVLPLSDALRAWAEAHPAEFADRKSIHFPAGVIGFRTGTPKLKLVRPRTWDHVLAALQSAGLGGYVRTRAEVDKEAILADRHVLLAKELRALGLKITRDESIFIEPSLGETPTEIHAPANTPTNS